MKVFVNGGLGNQLFQFSFAHMKGNNISVFLDAEPRLDRPFELDGLIANCDHTKVCVTIPAFNFKWKLRLARLIRLSKSEKLIKFSAKLIKICIEPIPYTAFSKNSLNENVMYAGYFQHWKNVESSWINFEVELMNHLEQVFLPEDIDFKLKDSVVIHIRQGDLVNVKESMGILSSDYYSKALQEISHINPRVIDQLIILSDDVARVEEIIKESGLKPRLILSSSDLNAWQTLKIMSQSNFLIAANSTLSWWGGFLSSKKGGLCVLPKPWFKNWHEEVGEAFYFPKALQIESSFL
jgi:hypothetical protein